MSAADIKTVVHVCESYIHIIICILVGMGWVGIHFGTGVATSDTCTESWVLASWALLLQDSDAVV